MELDPNGSLAGQPSQDNKLSVPWETVSKIRWGGAGEKAQWLRALDALPEVLSSSPSNHMVAHNHL